MGNKKRRRSRYVPEADRVALQTNTRFAVVNAIHQEVLSANHQAIGEAFNSAAEDYIPNFGIVVVATQQDKILGEVRRSGELKECRWPLPATIWDGAKHPFYDPNHNKENHA